MRPAVVLLDACGVILNDPLPGLIESIGRSIGEDPVDTIARYASLRLGFWTGVMSEAVFWNELCSGREPERWADRLAASFAPGPASGHLEAWSLKARLRVLSNHRTRWMQGHLARFGLGAYFERVVVSDAIGYAKPHPEAFESALADAGVSPAQVLFVDDKQRNVSAARALGLQAVWADPTSGWLAEVGALLDA